MNIKRHPFFINLGQPMPLTRKARLVLRNSWTKVRHSQRCCGRPGEPGC